MPEGDTVHITARRLNAALRAQPVTLFDIRTPALALADLTGSTIDDVTAVGKHLLMRFSCGQTLHSHLRMDGAWRVVPIGPRPRGVPDHLIRALVGTPNSVATGIRVHDLSVVPTGAEKTLVGHLGPDLVLADADLAEALRRYQNQPERTVESALLDQRLAAGIGNVYKSELLFLHRLDPWLTVAEVSDLEAVLVDAARLLRGNLGDYNRSTTGWRQRGQQYWVYGRAGKGCRRCGTAVRLHAPTGQQERLTYYCPQCQAVTRQPRL